MYKKLINNIVSVTLKMCIKLVNDIIVSVTLKMCIKLVNDIIASVPYIGRSFIRGLVPLY